MRLRQVLLGVLAAASLSGFLGGCVYYNGMYNANRLARSAWKAERDGRTFEANRLWGQVATKAESVLVRHPTSKYAPDAGLLKGVALARLGQCDQALGPLGRLTFSSSNADLAEEALLAAGRCHVALGNMAAGGAAFSQLLGSKSPERRREARFQQARLLREAGQYQEALTALEGNHEPRAEHERVLALAGSGQMGQALGLADSLMAKGDTTKSWDSLVVTLAEAHPAAASNLLDRVRQLPNHSVELQARMLLDDGIRLMEVNPSRAAQRFRQAIALGPRSHTGGQARLALIKLELRRATQPAELQSVVDTLTRLLDRFESSTEEITSLSKTAATIGRAGTVLTPDSVQGDLRLFLAAEAARDQLEAPRLAETLFRQLAERWPASPYAPKAILAAQSLNPAWADTARVLLEQQYYDSPYLATIRGEVRPEYRQLEDSLGFFAASLVKKAVPARRLPPAGAPRRRPEPVSGSNVPEVP